MTGRTRTRVGPLATSNGSAPAMDVDGLLDDRDTGIIVCCGSGGVGKTTTSAALALRAAERGRKVVVLTIDPARRLAQAMGIERLDNTPRPVAGLRTNGRGNRRGGSLDARAPSPGPRSTWRWRSSASSTRTPAATAPTT